MVAAGADGMDIAARLDERAMPFGELNAKELKRLEDEEEEFATLVVFHMVTSGDEGWRARDLLPVSRGVAVKTQ